jgi:hypothetical protein
MALGGRLHVGDVVLGECDLVVRVHAATVRPKAGRPHRYEHVIRGRRGA